jgi:predicted nucleic acid-binding protein
MSYIDTSVLVAYYCPEPISAKAEKVILRADPPAVSHLAENEIIFIDPEHLGHNNGFTW